jgi:hypothetical protein
MALEGGSVLEEEADGNIGLARRRELQDLGDECLQTRIL